MPSDNVLPAFFRFLNGEDMDIDENATSLKRRTKKDRLKAYKKVISPEMLEVYREEYKSKKDILQHISFTEYTTFYEENRGLLLQEELFNIRTKHFSFPIIQHSDHLVEFYTGIPNSEQFYYISGMLQGLIFTKYMHWDMEEKHGFLNHTMMALMMLRLNLTDKELAARFGVEPYVVNMTIREWLPAMYLCIYKGCEDMYKVPSIYDATTYTKAVDVVEVCFETPECTRKFRNNQHEARKAVVCVRNDGLITFASPVVSDHRPDPDTIKRSRFADICYNIDLVAVRPEHYSAVASMGIGCSHAHPEAEKNMEEAVSRLSEFRILMAIPEEYKTYHEFIFPVCAALSNYYLDEEDYVPDDDELPDDAQDHDE